MKNVRLDAIKAGKGRKIEKVLYIKNAEHTGDEISVKLVESAIEEAIGKCDLKYYKSPKEAEERENLSEFDVLVIDATDDNDKQKWLITGMDAPYFTERFREINPTAHIIAISLEREYLLDGIARRLYDDTILTWEKEQKELVDQIKRSIKYAGFDLNK